MLSWLVTTSLRCRVAVVALAVLLLVAGVVTARKTPLDVFPEFAPPLIEIQTEAPGLSTQEVESLVTVPLENALNGTSWLKTIRSKSVLGLSSVVLILEEGSDLMRARQLVQERLAVEAPRLPAVARPPVILSPLSSTSRAVKIGVWSAVDSATGRPRLSQMDLTELAKWTIRPRLMAVSGVANVAIWGQRDRQFQVLVDPERLRAHNVTLDAVLRAAGDATAVAAGGFVDTPNQRMAIRHASAVVEPDDLARTVVEFRDQAPLRLGDVAEVVVGPNFTELWISLEPDADYAATVAKVQEVVDGYPGLYRDLLTYLKERIKEVLSGAGATIVVRVYGPDLAVLREKAHEIERAMADVSGVTNLKVEPQVLVPQVEVRLRPNAADLFGLTPGQIRRAATTLVKGTKVGEVYEQQRVFDVAVWGAEHVRADLAALNDLRIDTPAGAQLPLRDVAVIEITPAPNEIKREGASRRIDVTCNVQGRDLGSVAREIREKVEHISFDREYHPEFLGEYAAREEARRRLLAFTGLSLAGILLLLYMDFASVRLTLLVFLTIPFALIGGVAAALLGGGVLSLGSLVGFVTVLGIAARNGIMLVSHLQHLELHEGEPFGRALILRGAEERLAPILMTALCASLALLPIVLRGNVPGHEIEYPMAVVILGGLVTSTALNLFQLPALFATFGRVRREAETSLTA